MAKVITRQEQEEKNTWNLETIFESDAAFEEKYKELESRLGEEERFRGQIDSLEALADALETERELSEEIGKIFVYAHLKHDQDTSDDTYSALESKARTLVVKFNTAWSFLVPEIMKVDEETLEEWRRDPRLSEFSFDLEKLNRKRAYVLSDKEEKLLAQAGEVMSNPTSTFGMFNNADLGVP